jgi:hypothetical protein
MPPERRLIYLAAFDRDEDGELVPVFERQFESLHEAIDEAREIADQHDGVIAWVREGSAYLREYGPPKALFWTGDLPLEKL